MALRRIRNTHCGFRILDFGLIGGFLGAVLLVPAASGAAEAKPEPSFMHGVGQVVGGLIFELPKTTLEATLDGPPVVGTAVGLLAGTARALQKVAGGLVGMAASFDPWGAKRRPRSP